MTIGRLERKKNTAGLVAAFARLKQQRQFANLKLLLVGSPGLGIADVDVIIAAEGLAADVYRPGWLPEADVPLLMAGAACFVLPSYFEGFGIPVLEAMAVGTPVVCSAVTSLPEVSGNAAILVDPHDPQAIASGMASVLTDSSQQSQLQAKGLAQSKNFSWDRSAKLLAHVLTGR